MEFFRTVNTDTTEQVLQTKLALNHLDQISSELFNLGEPEEGSVDIGGIWGEFTLTRNEIRGGVRFALVECPNALCWTITTGYPPAPDATVIHLTINRTEKDAEFLEEVTEFLDDLSDNLSEYLPR
ncbi:MAG: hypothetical protein JXQ90_09685 [Cyclobacteriaceae bacterium]